ncbi:MAG: S4 domain-containing protein [Casimicrobiaceae bacterium]
MRAKTDTCAEPTRIRMDKWLWAARFYKTRSLAAAAIEAGQARLATERVKPGQSIRIGDDIVLRRSGLVWHIRVAGLSERRGGAPDAAKLYSEASESVAARELEAARRKAASTTAPTTDGRPTKRDRRKLQEFLDEA